MLGWVKDKFNMDSYADFKKKMIINTWLYWVLQIMKFIIVANEGPIFLLEVIGSGGFIDLFICAWAFIIALR